MQYGLENYELSPCLFEPFAVEWFMRHMHLQYIFCARDVHRDHDRHRLKREDLFL